MEEPCEIECPWCGEIFTSFVDPMHEHQSYIEDCQVCCRPINLQVRSIEPLQVESIRS